MTADEVIAVARKLSPDERALVIAAIDPAKDEFVVTDELRDELDRRIAAHGANPTAGISWADLKAKWGAGR
jgi:putative addiction module component (TIGR02574 family)